MRHPLAGTVAFLLSLLAALPAGEAPSFDVRRFGATGDGTTMDTAAIQKAVDAAATAGGGTVVLPAGTYLSGSIILKSHVKMRIDQGATLQGSTTLADYRRLNFLALVQADRQEDIGISGKGVIDGQGGILAAGTTGPVSGGSKPDANEARRPVIINFRNCRNVTVRDVTLLNSACWVQLYRECRDLLVENVTVRSLAAITSDGIDIDSCARVVVRGCDIDSEDDGICLKSGPKLCEDVLIENCRVRSSCNALKLGTASVTGFRNITCRNLDIHDTYISAIALEMVDGGRMEDVTIAQVRITDTCNPLFIRLGQRNVDGKPGSIQGVTISDVTADIPDRPREQMDKFPPGWRHRCTTLVTGSITGLPGHPVRDVTLRDITITYGGIGTVPKANHLRLDALERIPECADRYPESTMFGVLPAWGLYCRHAENITCRNVTLQVKGRDYRSALVGDDVRNLTLDGLRVLSAGTQPVIVFKDVLGAVLRECPAPPGKVRFLETMGGTRDVTGP